MPAVLKKRAQYEKSEARREGSSMYLHTRSRPDSESLDECVQLALNVHIVFKESRCRLKISANHWRGADNRVVYLIS